MKKEERKLDNPVWNSLNETHSAFSINCGGLKFYQPAYCSFGGFINTEDLVNGMDKYAQLISSFYVVGEKPQYGSKLKLEKKLVCHQMVLEKPFSFSTIKKIVELKSDDQKRDLFALVNLVQPGYFNSRTSDLGKYLGIYIDGALVAATGERMKMNAFTEVSAVVTHPQYTGRGYATQLIKRTTDHIFNESKTPYLHVAESNSRAIGLYKKLGFVRRRKINFWNFVKV